MPTPSISEKLDPKALRASVLRMSRAGSSVHVACAFSIVEIISAIYSDFVTPSFDELKDWKRDHFILSKGHGVMAMYAAHEKLGWLDRKHLENYFADGSLLHGLCEADMPGFEVTSGSLGHGLPVATGLAFSFKRRGLDNNVYCLVGDGEMDEGPMWEALLFANQHELSNLTVIVDANGFQAMGHTEKIASLEPLKAKFESFGFSSIECDGHSLSQLRDALVAPSSGRPKAIIARTVKGKGVSFMENDNSWHYLRLNDDLLKQALRECEG